MAPEDPACMIRGEATARLMRLGVPMSPGSPVSGGAGRCAQEDPGFTERGSGSVRPWLSAVKRRVIARSGRRVFVVIMQAAEVRDLDDASLAGRMDLAGAGAVLLERLVVAPAVVVVEVVGEQSSRRE